MDKDSIIEAIIVEDSALLNGTDILTEEARRALGRIRHWNVHLGVASTSRRSTIVQSALAGYPCDFFFVEDSIVSSLPDALVYLASKASFQRPSFLNNLSNPSIILLDPSTDGINVCNTSQGFYTIFSLDQLPLVVCLINSQALANKAFRVGYSMKPSREEDFAKRGALPVSPTPNGLVFFPLSFRQPLPPQLQFADAVLHKATDEIVSIEHGDSTTVTFSSGIQALQKELNHRSSCVIIDPIQNIYPVLDRLTIQQVLSNLSELNPKQEQHGRRIIRGPSFLLVKDFNEPDFPQLLSISNLSFPCIVKPQVACGLDEAHSMALVFDSKDFNGLKVPLPGIIQEYVDHSSTLYKIYCLGGKVFQSVKNSIPSSDVLLKFYEENGCKPLLFHSLKSLPTNTDKQIIKQNSLDLDLVADAANWLSTRLDLTIFGFDVVIDEHSGDHVIVDVNYLPSFKEVKNDVALPSFWAAIRRKIDVSIKKCLN